MDVRSVTEKVRSKTESHGKWGKREKKLTKRSKGAREGLRQKI